MRTERGFGGTNPAAARLCSMLDSIRACPTLEFVFVGAIDGLSP